MTETLAPPQVLGVEKVIYDRLQLDETSIRVLYHAAFGTPHSELPSNRTMQQSLGPYIARLNRKIEGKGEKVVPGVARRTYRLGTAQAGG